MPLQAFSPNFVLLISQPKTSTFKKFNNNVESVQI